jgi:TolA-binding protein
MRRIRRPMHPQRSREEGGTVRTLLAVALFAFAGLAVAKSHDAYVLCGPGAPEKVTISSSASVTQLTTVCARYGSNFLWVRRNGREMVIRDAAFLARAHRLFEPLRALDPERRAINKAEKAADREEEHLDELSDHGADMRQQLREVRQKQREVAAQERDLDRREDDLERTAEAELWRMVDEEMGR